MKNHLKKLGVTLLIIASIISCKKKEKEKIVEETPVEVVDFYFLDMYDMYPEEYNAIPVEKKESSFKVKSKPKHSDNAAKKEEPVETEATDYDATGGHIVVDENQNMVSGLFLSVTEKDTLELHVTEVDTVFTTKKSSKRRMKGYGYIKNKEYTFDTPVQITKTETGIEIDDEILLSPVTTDVEVGDTEVTEKDTDSDQYMVKIKTRHNGKKIIKLENMRTHKHEKLVYDKHGKLLKDRKRGGHHKKH